MTHFQVRGRRTTGLDAGALVASAARLRWRAPELALLMADQASTAAAIAGVEPTRLRAEVLAVFACNQLGRGVTAGGRALRALRAARTAGEATTERLIRVELAACAADASAPAVGLTVLRPVLERMSSSAPTARAAAMVTAADCVARLGGGPHVAALLRCADQLYDTSRGVEPDAVLLRRGVVHARLAAYYRRLGDSASAENTARAGLDLIAQLDDDDLDTGQVSGALVGELVLALLDRGQVAEAVVAAQPVLLRPARPAGAATACWLRLALVSRVHLPAGRHVLARRLLGEAAADAERNHLDSALGECRQLQAQLHETCAELAEALHSVRAAYVADRRWRDAAAELRALLAAEFGQPVPAADLRSELARVIDNFQVTDLSTVPTRARPGRSSDRMLRSRHAVPTPLPIPHPAASRAEQPGWTPVPADRAGVDDDRINGVEPIGRRSMSQSPAGEPPAAEPLTPSTAGHRRMVTADQRPAVPDDQGPAVVDDHRTAVGDEPGDRPVSGEPGDSAADRPVGPGGSNEADAAQSDVDDWRADSLIVPASLISATPSVPSWADDQVGSTTPIGAGRHGEPAASRHARPADPDATPIGTSVAAAGRHESPVVERHDESAVPAPAAPAVSAPAAPDVSAPAVPDGLSHDLTPAPVNRPWAEAAQDSGAGLPAADVPDPMAASALPAIPQPAAVNGHDRGAGRHRSDVAMADLLAEALLAYQNGRRSRLAATAEPSPDTQPGHEPAPPTAAAPAVPPTAAPTPSPTLATVPSITTPPTRPQPTPLSTPPLSTRLPSTGGSSTTAAATGEPAIRPKIRWVDLPRELVWREPGLGRPRA